MAINMNLPADAQITSSQIQGITSTDADKQKEAETLINQKLKIGVAQVNNQAKAAAETSVKAWAEVGRSDEMLAILSKKS